MNKHIVLAFLATVCLCQQVWGQDSLSMEKLFQWDGSAFDYNDCWGYTDPSGNEYAILGARNHIYFFDITDPTNTTLVDEFNNNNPSGLVMTSSIWRDFKTYEDKAYAVADQGNQGLIVFDLSGLPTEVTVDTQITSFFNRSHNLFIDTTSGYLYTAGANDANSDVIILDLNTDPITEVTRQDLPMDYIHDLHVRNDTAYCNAGGQGLYVIDFRAPTSPVLLGTLDGYLDEGYNHSCWLTDDGDHLVFCDENIRKKVKICDVSDLNDISITDQFFSNLLNVSESARQNIAHNPFILGDYVYVAYYQDGVQVYDISDPDNVVLHAYYDTHPQNTNYNNEFDGCWGVYPYFDSGSIIASDGDNGLFVLRLEPNALPVELIDFTGQAVGEAVHLNWSTASERNSDYFLLERSTDSRTFEPLGQVPARGNSAIQVDYQYIDPSPRAGLNYYRLRQVDLDGSVNFSEVIAVRRLRNDWQVHPTFINGDRNRVQVEGPSENSLQIELVNIHGQQLARWEVVDPQSPLQLPDLPNGIYLLQFQQNSQIQQVEKIVISR